MSFIARTQPLDYLSPDIQTPDCNRIYAWLATRHCLGVTGAALGIVAGLSVAVASAWAASGLVSMAVNRFAHEPMAVGWPSFWAILLIGVPLLIWRTLRTGGEFYADQVIDSNLFYGKPGNRSEWSHRGNVATYALYGDLLFWGPRLIIDGSRRLLGRDVLRSAATLRRASYIISHLLKATEPARVRALRFPGEPLEDLRTVLRWLDRHDYIGISVEGDRFWLASDTRDTLCLMLNLPARRLGRRVHKVASKLSASTFMDKLKSVDTLSKR